MMIEALAARSGDDWSWLTALLGSDLHPGGEALSRRVVALCDLPPSGTIVDLGAGDGTTLARARADRPSLRAVGIDAHPIRGHGPQGIHVRASGLRLPIREESADAVLAECSLCLMRPFEGALRQAFRILRPGGRLVFSDFYRTAAIRWSSVPLATWACVDEVRSADEVLRTLGDVGFEDVRLEDHSGALWELEDRIQQVVDVRGLLETLAAASPDPFWRAAASFVEEARDHRDAGRLRYGIFFGRRPRLPSDGPETS